MLNYKNIINVEPHKVMYQKDSNYREINIYKLNNVYLYGDKFYPNCLFSNDIDLINPSTERVMSLDRLKLDIPIQVINNELIINETPVFYFIYNTDNYYHFIYDTLPYLITYFELKKDIPKLKLLMNYPNFSKKNFYKFVSEFIDLLGIPSDDIIIDNNYRYKEIYISSSFTHGIDSNLPPRKEIYEFYKSIVDLVYAKSTIDLSKLPKKIYISRRTWIHGDISNIGTNYTNKRKFESEDKLVNFLKDEGFEEIFAENLSTIEKIIIFNNAELVIGAIGGGLCNVLFGNNKLNLLCIVSPTFLDINYRFKYCFDRVNCFYYDETFHTENGDYKKWMRVKHNSIVGEIEEIDQYYLTIAYTDNVVAGWNSEIEYKKIKIKKELCEPLDKGLNSSWDLNLNNLCQKIKQIQ